MQMEAQSRSRPSASARGFDAGRRRCKDAGFAALVTFGLSFPILAYQTPSRTSRTT